MFGMRKDYLYFSIVIILAIAVSVVSWKMANSIVYNTSIALVGEHTGNKSNKNTLPISIISPEVLQEIKSPVYISGEAKGTWFFEASFPVQITDQDGKVLGQGPVTAKTDWMTEKMVAFEGTIPFEKGVAKNGFVVFTPDDPSGLDRFEPIKISVIFEETEDTMAPCTISGCSAQLCSDTSMMSTCEYKEEYACYQTAKCERQPNGKCSWTESPELAQCLKDKGASSSVSI